MITWRPIAELPDELKDGRQVLLWDKDEPQGWSAVVATFDTKGWHWRDDEFRAVVPTHFAEINAPEALTKDRPVTVGKRVMEIPTELVLPVDTMPTVEPGERRNFRIEDKPSGEYMTFTANVEPVMGEPLGSGKVRLFNIRPATKP